MLLDGGMLVEVEEIQKKLELSVAEPGVEKT